MAKILDLDVNKFNQWISGCPAIIHELAKRLPPDRLYLLKTTRQRVTLCSYNENGTVTVNVSGEFNLTAFDAEVFGINPNDLEECDLPSKDEPVGALLTDRKEIEDYIEEIRPAVLAARGLIEGQQPTMNNHILTADEEIRSPHRNLSHGEWQLWCPKCSFAWPKNSAGKPLCPECDSRWILIAQGATNPP